jgi:hypothetical protein
MCLEGVEKSLDESCDKWARLSERPNGFFVAGIKEDLRKLFSADGLYCESNWKNYKNMEQQVNDFYVTLDQIAKCTLGYDVDPKMLASEVLTKYYGEVWKK